MNVEKPYIYSTFFDTAFIILPAFFSVGIALCFSDFFSSAQTLGLWGWAILVMGIDVSHVWSTIFRTYADRETFHQHKFFLLIVPVIVWFSCFLLYSMGSMIFWRVMAYLAVYHFVRQQYGFMRIYSRNEKTSRLESFVDSLTIYSGALWPVLYWHFYGPRHFNWFIDGDFLYFPSIVLSHLFTVLYATIILVYILKETRLTIRNRTFNFARNGIIIGTCLSWYFAIVYFNSDRAFTLINVVSHGIPYMAIVFAFGLKKYLNNNSPRDRPLMRLIFSRTGIILFICILLFFAYAEETLWDVFVWKEVIHRPLFAFFHNIMNPSKSDGWLLFFVPLLSVPQISHYIIDGFIWKIRKDQYHWTKVALETRSS